jgi:hypothetical protein
MTLLILDKVKVFGELWKTMMPQEAALPPDSTFIIWLGEHSDEEVQKAIIATSKKMRKKLRDGLVIGATDADRYCSSILSSRWRAQR